MAYAAALVEGVRARVHGKVAWPKAVALLEWAHDEVMRETRWPPHPWSVPAASSVGMRFGEELVWRVEEEERKYLTDGREELTRMDKNFGPGSIDHCQVW